MKQQQAAREKATVKKEEGKKAAAKTEEPEAASLAQRSTRSGGAPAPIPRHVGAKKRAGRNIKATSKKGGIEDYFSKATTKALADAAATEGEETKLGEHKNLRSARQPSLITGGVMKDYQLEGLEWLVSLYENGLNGILADEMGLGKTLQTISFLAFLREKGVWGPFLVVGPVSVLASWVDEIGRWAPDMPRLLYHGTPPERAELRRKRMAKLGPSFPIICTNYEMVMNDKKFLSQYKWKFIIIDEGHRLKNMNCKLVQELKSYNSANRLLLTGTPLQNNLAELWSLLNFLLPDIFDDYAYFEDYFDFSKLQGKDKESHVAFLEEQKKNNLVGSLHHLLKPFLLRRVKTDVETNLPPKKEYVLYAPLSQTQKDLYGALLDHRAQQWLQEQVTLKHSATSSKKRKFLDSVSGNAKKAADMGPLTKRKKTTVSYRELEDDEFFEKLEEAPPSDAEAEAGEELTEYEKSVMQALRQVGNKKLQNLLMQLRLACNSPHLFYWPWAEEKGERPDETVITESGKMMLLERLVPALLQRDHKVLIFSQFKHMLDIIQDWAEYLHGWKTCRLDGGVSQNVRREEIQKFNTNKNAKIFLLTTRAGGLGINLTASDTVILFDSDWNPQMDLQAQDRAHRIGQTKPVVIYRFATANTVEQTLLDKADGKRRLEKLIIQKGKFKSLASSVGGNEDEAELSAILLKEDLEKVTVADKGQQVLTDDELEALLDRSPEAFERSSVGEAGEGKAAVRVV
ncbi:putative SNF2 family helicase/ATPase PasG [Sphaerosporella brunnea]|uniref:Putative SNF2 family helicase/ATPase PasG n=1 Tax=Sphaerosporella brunnea TaxID=1250544 RepID=A0A5J5EUI3_9PEZI|nr:putative SNF2 family helicase/ATPase PasG [Sphaerosporella brunnea]